VACPWVLERVICFTCFVVSTIGVYLDLQICEAHVAGQLQQQWNAEQKTAYAFEGDQWVGYDNIAAVKIKVRLIKCNSYCGNFSTNILQVPGCNTRQVNSRNNHIY
jgi:GH18 family chitinase